jgi:outer membrane protease
MVKNAAYSHTIKNIPAFIFFVIIFYVFLTAANQKAYPQSQAGFGKDSRFSFSVYPLAGILYGQAEEIAYRNPEDADYFSRLLWDIKPLAYAGAGLSFSMNELRDAPGFYTDISFKAGIPAKTGRHENRDWLLPDSSILTNYSVHDNYTTQSFLANIAFGISLPLRHRNRVVAFLKIEGAVRYMFFDWIARDGYLQYDTYSGWDPSDPKTPVYGDVLTYYQHWLMVSPGIAVTIPIRSRWLVEVSLNAASGSIWAWNRDEHLDPSKRMEFYDYPTGGVMLEPGLEISYSFNKRLRLTADISYRYIRGGRGNTGSRQVGADSLTWSDNMAGAGFGALDAGLALKVFF